MTTNKTYAGAQDMPELLPLFPLRGVLLLPRGHMPLNIFEPRYLAMVDDAMASHRMIGVIQPDVKEEETTSLMPVGCAGRITQLAETGDGRYTITLTGIARFRLVEERASSTLYRQALVGYNDFAQDFLQEDSDSPVDRKGIMRALRGFADANNLDIDWSGIDEAPDEALVNALAMMSPFGPREKQALLEAASLKLRADVLIAMTEMELARGQGSTTSLQ